MKFKFFNFEFLPEKHVFFDIFLNPPHSAHLISKFVGLFESCVTASNGRFKVAWEDELGAELSDETWDRCLTAVRSCSVNSRHQLIQFKVIHRLHYTKTKLHKMFSSVSPFCDKCKVMEDTTAHAFWYCPSLSVFWTSIFDWFFKAYNRPLLLDVELAIFGFSQHTSSLPKALQQALTLGMIVAKRLILKNWKSSSPSSFRLWTMDMFSVIQMERLRFLRSNAIEKFSAVWGSFLGYLDKQANKPMSNVSCEV